MTPASGYQHDSLAFFLKFAYLGLANNGVAPAFHAPKGDRACAAGVPSRMRIITTISASCCEITSTGFRSGVRTLSMGMDSGSREVLGSMGRECGFLDKTLVNLLDESAKNRGALLTSAQSVSSTWRIKASSSVFRFFRGMLSLGLASEHSWLGPARCR